MGAGIVTLREGFEAALVVVLVLAFLEPHGSAGRLCARSGAGVAACRRGVSVAAAAGLLVIGAELEGNAEAVVRGRAR